MVCVVVVGGTLGFSRPSERQVDEEAWSLEWGREGGREQRGEEEGRRKRKRSLWRAENQQRVPPLGGAGPRSQLPAFTSGARPAAWAHLVDGCVGAGL